jgi:NAD(P)-dependent dehydrogenase (short-subunit alcohol dehydrogenase family)
MVSLEGKSAVVTGGSRGIGLAIAAALVGRGSHVLIAGRDDQRLAQARASLPGAADAALAGSPPLARVPGRVETARTDVRDYAQVEQAIGQAVAAFGGLDILVNNAGTGLFTRVADQSLAQWHEIIDTNLTGVFHCCRAALPHLRRRGEGWIINVSSLAGRNPFAGGAAYCASKAGLNAFSEALMQEVRYDDIRVSCVMPGSVRTAFAGTDEGETADWKLAPEDVAQVVVDLLQHDPRSLPSRVEIRPAKPRHAR